MEDRPPDRRWRCSQAVPAEAVRMPVAAAAGMKAVPAGHMQAVVLQVRNLAAGIPVQAAGKSVPAEGSLPAGLPDCPISYRGAGDYPL